MSTPEEIQNETQADQPMDVAAAVGQLRVLVCGLGAALILVSLALSGFVIKQSRDIGAATNNHQHQIAQLQATQKPAMGVLNELAKYSQGKPELTALFTKHGLQFTPPGGAAPQR
jgi:hypothetical protein